MLSAAIFSEIPPVEWVGNQTLNRTIASVVTNNSDT